MTDEIEWNDEDISLLHKTTRELKFDWNLISDSLSQHFASVSNITLVSPQICRQLFAKTHARKIEASGTVRNEVLSPSKEHLVRKVDVSHGAEHTSAFHTETHSVLPDSSKVQILKSYEEMSLEDLIQHVADKEIQMNQRKEEIFTNILTSLTGAEGETNETTEFISSEIQEIKQKFLEQQKQRELEKLRREQMVHEQQERESLEQQRLKLKQRFDLHSEDAQGENPLKDVDYASGGGLIADSQEKHSTTSSQIHTTPTKASSNNSSGVNSTSKQSFNASSNVNGDSGLHAAAETPQFGIIDTNLESILYSTTSNGDTHAFDQFDFILESLEKEFDSLAVDKTEDTSSELWEVLNVLDNAAKEKHQQQQKSKQQSVNQKTTATTSPVKQSSADGKQSSQSSAANESSPSKTTAVSSQPTASATTAKAGTTVTSSAPPRLLPQMSPDFIAQLVLERNSMHSSSESDSERQLRENKAKEILLSTFMKQQQQLQQQLEAENYQNLVLDDNTIHNRKATPSSTATSTSTTATPSKAKDEVLPPQPPPANSSISSVNVPQVLPPPPKQLKNDSKSAVLDGKTGVLAKDSDPYGRSTKRTATKDTSAANQNDNEHDSNSDSNSDDDDDENWRNVRQNKKQEAQKVATTIAGAGSNSAEATKSSPFWGAFGKETKAIKPFKTLESRGRDESAISYTKSEVTFETASTITTSTTQVDVEDDEVEDDECITSVVETFHTTSSTTTTKVINTPHKQLKPAYRELKSADAVTFADLHEAFGMRLEDYQLDGVNDDDNEDASLPMNKEVDKLESIMNKLASLTAGTVPTTTTPSTATTATVNNNATTAATTQPPLLSAVKLSSGSILSGGDTSRTARVKGKVGGIMGNTTRSAKKDTQASNVNAAVTVVESGVQSSPIDAVIDSQVEDKPEESVTLSEFLHEVELQCAQPVSTTIPIEVVECNTPEVEVFVNRIEPVNDTNIQTLPESTNTSNKTNKQYTLSINQTQLAKHCLFAEHSDVPFFAVLHWLLTVCKRNKLVVKGLQCGVVVNKESVQRDTTAVHGLETINETTDVNTETDTHTENNQNNVKLCTVVLEPQSHTTAIKYTDFVSLLQTTSLCSVLNNSLQRDTSMATATATSMLIISGDVNNEIMLTDFMTITDTAHNSGVQSTNDTHYVNNNGFGMNVNNLISCDNNTNDIEISHQITSANIVTSLLKDYVIQEYRGDILYSYISQIESNGMRLAGMRLVYIPKNHHELDVYKNITHNFMSFTNSNYTTQPHSDCIAVLCLALYSTNKTEKLRCITDKLRTIHGPDDCLLALKTDPQSLRALYGEHSTQLTQLTTQSSTLQNDTYANVNSIQYANNNRNIFYNIPYSSDKIHYELRFFFAQSVVVAATAIDTPMSESTLSLLYYTQPRKLFIGVSFELLQNNDNKNVLATLQNNVLQTLTDNLVNSNIANFCGLHSVTMSKFRSLLSTSVTSTATATSSNTSSNTQYLVFEFQTYASEVYKHTLDTLLDTEINTLNSTNTVWNTKMNACFMSVLATELTVFSELNCGSQLALVDVMKADSNAAVKDQMCFKSHLDVGLSDICILAISTTTGSNNTNNCVNDGNAQLIALTKVLTQLPATCHTTVIASKLQHNALNTQNAQNIQLLVILRGYQLLETIDSVVALVQNTAQTTLQTTHGTVSKQNNTNVTIKCYKNKRACEILLTEFHTDCVFTTLAQYDLQKYLPNYNNNTAMNNDKIDSKQVAFALFPCGSFIGTSVLFIPLPTTLDSNSNLNSNASITSNLSRILTRIEKDNFSVLDIKIVNSVSTELLCEVVNDNLNEYNYTELEGVSDGKCNTISSSTSSFVVLLVRHNSVHLKIKTLCGPVLDCNFAMLSYPRSFSATLHSLATLTLNTTNSDNNAVAVNYALLPTLTVATTKRAISELFSVKNSSLNYDKVVSLNTVHNSVLAAVDATESDNFATQHSSTNNTNNQVVNTDFMSRVNKNTRHIIKNIAELVGNAQASNSNPLDILKAKTSDLSCIILTHTLLLEVGLAAIVDALHREGIQIVNIFTSHITSTVLAKNLLDLAGQSSLSMKPSQSVLCAGPCVFIGLEGSAHSFIKFKSMSVWKLHTGEWGIIASSSSRLAKDLFAFCFDRIYHPNSMFVLENTTNATTSVSTAVTSTTDEKK